MPSQRRNPGQPKRAAQAPKVSAKDLKTQHILAKLEEPISMSFTEDTPLEDVLKYIKQATTTPDLRGHSQSTSIRSGCKKRRNR